MATCPTCRARFSDDASSCPEDGSALLPDEAARGLDADLAPGHRVGEYRIEAKIGDGGFGAVYRAVHPIIGKAAAVKVLHRRFSSDAAIVARFVAEARAVNQIGHKNVVDIFSFGALEDGRQYYVMELLDGVTLARYLGERGRLDPVLAVRLFRPLARALEAAHKKGIAHRDLKPENVFLTPGDDETPAPKLLDFGIAKLLGDDAAVGVKTRTGAPLGTPYYMSPEQCRGRRVDHRTDVYAFGVLVHEALTGRRPITGDDVMDVMMKHATEPPPRASEVCPDLPPELDAPILHMLEKAPEARPSSVVAALETLAAAARRAGLPIDAHPTETTLGPPQATGSQGRFRVTAGELVEVASAPTLTGSEADVRRPARRRALLLAAALLLSVSAALITVLALRRLAPPLAAAAGDAAPSASPPAETTVTPAEPPRPVVVAPAAAAPLPPAEVEVVVHATPPGALIHAGSTLLGRAPGPVRLARGERSVLLQISAPGHRTAEVAIVPTSHVVIPVTLQRAPSPAPRPARSASGDLENPFR